MLYPLACWQHATGLTPNALQRLAAVGGASGRGFERHTYGHNYGVRIDGSGRRGSGSCSGGGSVHSGSRGGSRANSREAEEPKLSPRERIGGRGSGLDERGGIDFGRGSAEHGRGRPAGHCGGGATSQPTTPSSHRLTDLEGTTMRRRTLAELEGASPLGLVPPPRPLHLGAADQSPQLASAPTPPPPPPPHEQLHAYGSPAHREGGERVARGRNGDHHHHHHRHHSGEREPREMREPGREMRGYGGAGADPLSPRGGVRDVSPTAARAAAFDDADQHGDLHVPHGEGDGEGCAREGCAAHVPVSVTDAPAAAPVGPRPPRVPVGVHAAYALSTMLGAGAFGTVWMATARESGEGCAIKIVERKRQLHEDFALEPAEAEILKQVHHPNIVKLIDLISSETCVYLVMELVLGGHLQARLKADGAYDEPRARVLIRQVVAAAQHLHARHVIHRDIKPENILFTERSDESLEVKLTDFGLSTMKEGRLTTRCGTPSYCAPELISGEGYGKAVDMWSLGVLTYVVLTGQLPFIGRDRADLFGRIQKGQYSYPPPATPGAEPTSELARDLISRLLKLEPMERYSTRETLQHPWLANDEGALDADGEGAPVEVDTDALLTVHEMMRGFIAGRRLRKAFHVVVACLRLTHALEHAHEPPAEERALSGAAGAAGSGSVDEDGADAQHNVSHR